LFEKVQINKLTRWIGTIENHGNMEITETVIFVKCRDFAKMPCFVVFLAKMLRFYRCYVFYKNFSFLVSINYMLLFDFDTEKFVIAPATKACMLCYLLAQYVAMTL